MYNCTVTLYNVHYMYVYITEIPKTVLPYGIKARKYNVHVQRTSIREKVHTTTTSGNTYGNTRA